MAPPVPEPSRCPLRRPGGGAVAQLGERRNRTAEVRGSNPLGSTRPSRCRSMRGEPGIPPPASLRRQVKRPAPSPARDWRPASEKSNGSWVHPRPNGDAARRRLSLRRPCGDR